MVVLVCILPAQPFQKTNNRFEAEFRKADSLFVQKHPDYKRKFIEASHEAAKTAKMKLLFPQFRK